MHSKQIQLFSTIYTKSPPVVTSPHDIKLYPPAVAVHNSSNAYVIPQSKMLCESIKTHGSESRGQEEAACMRVFWPTRPLQ